MSVENENTLTDQEAADVFADMAKTFDQMNGIVDSTTETVATETEGDTEEENNKSPAENPASAQETKEPAFDFESLPAAAKKRFQDLELIEHKFKSDEGRVSALQKKIDEQRHQLEQLQRQNLGDSKAAQKIEESIEQDEVDLGSIVEELPELGALVSEVKNLRKKMSGVSELVQEQVVTPGQARAAQEQQTRELESLQQTHSDYEQIQSDPSFWQWVDGQHESVRALGGSDSASDVSALLKLYKDSNPSKINPSSEQEPVQEKKIQRNIDDMAALKSDGNGRSILPTGDEDALYKHYAALADAGKL
ncbi:MAG TPA: hypothetical protein VN030_13825 [Cellvibrio sp.]|nr:hypothetical protein [Cellvibrio sp.]